MKVKEQVLLILQSNKSDYISGEAIAKQLYVSRNAVWKAINSLKQDGFQIDAVTNKGYRLINNGTGFTECRISSLLRGNAAECNIIFEKVVGSTNTELRRLAENGAKEKTVYIANAQTAGRGRRENVFFSPANSGIYMSILLRPQFTADKAFYITTAAAISAVKAIGKATGLKAEIKWVNDIMLDGGKVCGILTEGVTDFESGTLRYAVVGLGINVTRPENGFPKEIEDIAAPLYSDNAVLDDVRCEITAEILNNFFDIYPNTNIEKIISEYKKYSCVIGKRIKITSGNNEYYGTATDIDNQARLIVKDDNGNITTLSSAANSIKNVKEQV